MSVRVRMLLLLALVVTALAPTEAVLGEPMGSVVGQVASCVEPSGLLRTDTEVDAAAPRCATPRGPTVAVLVTSVVALLALLGRRRPAGRTTTDAAHRWRLVDALPGPRAPWRGPPLTV